MAKDSINLMPEDLRSKEGAVKAKVKKQNALPDLSVPEVQTDLARQELSGSKGKKSFWSKFKSTKPPKQEPEQVEAKIKPLPELDGGKNKKGFWSMFKSTKPPKQEPEQPEAKIKPLPELKPTPIVPVVPAPKVVAPVQQQAPKVPGNNQGFSLDVQAPVPVKEKIVPAEKDTQFHQPSKHIRARFVETGMGVDLVPTSAKVKGWKQISTLAIISFVASIGMIVVFYFGLLTINTSFNSNKTEGLAEIENIRSQLINFKESSIEINAVGKEIAVVLELLNKHIYWTNFFDLLEKYTIEDVYYSGFASSNNGALTLDATTINYYSVAKQLKVFQQEEASEFISKVEISGASASESGVSFSIAITLNPDLFYYQEINLE